MGTEIINEPDEDYRSVLLIRLKMVKEVFTILNEYPNLFGDDSEFEIAFFKDDQCYFYDTIHEMTFAFNLDVMLEFLKEKYHNNNPKTKNDIIFDFYNIKDGGFKQYNYNQYSWIEQDSIDKNIISKLFEYIKKKM